MAFNARTLIHSETFDRQASDLPVERIDEAVGVACWAIAIGADRYEVIPGTEGLRVAKTDPFVCDSGLVPGIKVWFTIVDESHAELRAMTLRVPADETLDGDGEDLFNPFDD